jgi:hypothetical protein
VKKGFLYALLLYITVALTMFLAGLVVLTSPGRPTKQLKQPPPGAACVLDGKKYSNGYQLRKDGEFYRCDHSVWVPAESTVQSR